MDEHPVQLIVEDDLRRNRLTVFFRLILAIPHLIWVFLGSIAIVFVAIATWVATLVRGRPPDSLHGWACAYVRYLSHLNAYLWLVANPYPGFVGEEGEYPVDVTLPPPAPQSRWKTLLRVVLAIPAILLSLAIGGRFSFGGSFGRAGGTNGRGYSSSFSGFSGGLATVSSVLGWFASVARGRMPKGLRDAGAYSVGYSAQVLAYLLFVTDRYPNADPTALLEGIEPPALAGARVLPTAARDPAPRLADPLVGRGDRRRPDQLVHHALRRESLRSAASLPLPVRPLHAARVRVSLSHSKSVPRFRRRTGVVSARRRAARPWAAEPMDHRLPDRARRSGSARECRARMGAHDCRRPDVVRGARDGLRAVGVEEPVCVCAAL